MTRLDAAIERAYAAVRQVAGVEVTYVWGTARIPMTAVKTEAEVEMTEADGTVVISRVTDWRVRAGDLAVDGDLVRPRRGNRIEHLAGGKLQIYEVMSVAEECYRPTDPNETEFRVHSKLIAE